MIILKEQGLQSIKLFLKEFNPFPQLISNSDKAMKLFIMHALLKLFQLLLNKDNKLKTKILFYEGIMEYVTRWYSFLYECQNFKLKLLLKKKL
jgi:hypothetical protein